MKNVALPLTAIAAAAGLLAVGMPAQAGNLSFTPLSGTLSFNTSTDALSATLFNAGSMASSTEELILSGSILPPNTLNPLGGGSYEGQISSATFDLLSLPSNTVTEAGSLTPPSDPFTFVVLNNGDGTYTTHLTDGGFTTPGGPVTLGNITIKTTDSPIGNTGPGNVSPVPELSSMASFGALLMLGGLALVRRRRIA